MAKAAHNTVTTRLPHPSDARIGQAARDWEGPVNDVFDFADVAAEIVDGLLHRNGEITLQEEEVSRILFCVYQMRSCAARFKASYYAAVDGAHS